ncbi:MAG: response regulator [Synergistaceae bacterium]|nr:response regulator [Synergistaceae bacterium]
MDKRSEAAGPAILIIDDDRRFLGITKKILELRGYETRSAASLEAARRSMKESMPDVIVLDVRFGKSDENGLGFCCEVREHSSVPIIFLTGLAGSGDVVAGLKAGGDDYLTKPVDFDVLEARIEAALRRVELDRKNLTGSENAGDHEKIGTAEIDEEKFARLAAKLSEQEKTAARLVALGGSNQEIAEKLICSVDYVKKLTSRIYARTGIPGRADLRKKLLK